MEVSTCKIVIASSKYIKIEKFPATDMKKQQSSQLKAPVICHGTGSNVINCCTEIYGNRSRASYGNSEKPTE